MSTILSVFALLLDQLLGEPRRYHPLAGFGCLAQFTEQQLNRSGAVPLRLMGLLSVVLLVAPMAVAAQILSDWFGPLFDGILLYLAVGAKSLAQHALRVVEALQRNDLPVARQRVGMMVSRDTENMERPAIVSATIESVLENGADAIFGALFWFLLAGAPGVVIYRLVNTLDAMWGYRTERFREFGWFVARLDDLLNWFPARLTALVYALAGKFRASIRCWSRQADRLDSPNGGVVMTAGAGALGLILGGPCSYHGETRDKPFFGAGFSPVCGDIYRAVDLVQKSVLYWVIAILIGGWLFA
ncbi:adenosylcobinamide-phosphate synthase CbiB [Sedimenticola thiotaurini]|uniref:Cobalamin biosynthesis protein CobD n=1 Tax=Sedimenticola thiotaurini TaxID=1543721 RepID=A0A0F7JY42_9GAMM|nr:adenosylcobinamide-phosphate synthase CbiB [Sedimenticola thiotaurini]AKH19573.1 cobalamin biosynthesis protein CobD [Sedimenticola thiotaurini]